jgi:putative inorganic carbon (HCO3(-)) transporter
MANINIPLVKKILNISIIVFLSIAAISSQFSVALSSIGAGGLIILIAARLVIDRKINIIDRKIFYLWGIYLIAQVISSMYSGDSSESFSNVFRRASLWPVFFAVFLFIDDLGQLKKIFIYFFLFTALVSSIELVRYLIDFYSQSVIPLSEFRLEYFGYPVTNGEIKMLILLLIIPLIFAKEKFVFNKIWLTLISMPVFLTLFFTNSRNAFLGVFSGLLIIGFLKNKYFLAALIIVTTLFILFAPPAIKERIESIVDLNHPSNHSRIVMWETGIKMIKDHPVIGFGDVDINKIYAQYKKPEFHGEGSHMHNNYVQILVMTGITGFLCWLAAMLYIFIKQIKLYRATKNMEVLNSIALMSLVSMIAFHVSGLTEWNFGDAEFAVVLWFNLGLVFLAEKLLKTNTAKRVE